MFVFVYEPVCVCLNGAYVGVFFVCASVWVHGFLRGCGLVNGLIRECVFERTGYCVSLLACV